MTRADFTHIAIVLDRSGSMASVVEDTIGGFNKFLSEQRNKPGKNLLTLVQFDNEYQIVHDGCPLADVPNLNHSTYEPRGSTALIDAIGRTIDRLGRKLADMPEHERPGKVIMCVITDGQENSSTEYCVAEGIVWAPPPILGGGRIRMNVGPNKFARVQQMIARQREKYQWEFVFLGANEDGIAQAAGSFGFQHVYSYTAGRVGTGQVFGAMSRGIGSYMSNKGFDIGDSPGIQAVVTPESKQ